MEERKKRKWPIVAPLVVVAAVDILAAVEVLPAGAAAALRAAIRALGM